VPVTGVTALAADIQPPRPSGYFYLTLKGVCVQIGKRVYCPGKTYQIQAEYRYHEKDNEYELIPGPPFMEHNTILFPREFPEGSGNGLHTVSLEVCGKCCTISDIYSFPMYGVPARGTITAMCYVVCNGQKIWGQQGMHCIMCTEGGVMTKKCC
jgi:hypothetical protein